MCNELYNVKFHKLELLIIIIIYVFMCFYMYLFFPLNEFTDVLSQMNCVLSTLNKQHFRPIYPKLINPKKIENQLYFILMYNKHKFEQALIPYFPNKQLRKPQKLIFHMKVLKLNIIRPLESLSLSFSKIILSLYMSHSSIKVQSKPQVLTRKLKISPAHNVSNITLLGYFLIITD